MGHSKVQYVSNCVRLMDRYPSTPKLQSLKGQRISLSSYSVNSALMHNVTFFVSDLKSGITFYLPHLSTQQVGRGWCSNSGSNGMHNVYLSEASIQSEFERKGHLRIVLI